MMMIMQSGYKVKQIIRNGQTSARFFYRIQYVLFRTVMVTDIHHGSISLSKFYLEIVTV